VSQCLEDSFGCGEFRQTEVLALDLGCARVVSKRAGLRYVSMFEVVLFERVRMFLVC